MLEEEILTLKRLQDGTITVAQASELLFNQPTPKPDEDDTLPMPPVPPSTNFFKHGDWNTSSDDTALREASVIPVAGGMVTVKNTLGDIEAVGADVPEVRVSGELEGRGADRFPQIQLVVENGENGPILSVSHPSKTGRVSLDLKVLVPNNLPVFTISLMTSSGDVSAGSIQNANLIVETKSGDVQAADISGDVAINTTSGDIALRSNGGAVQIRTLSGDVEAVRVSGTTFRAATQSGDVQLTDATAPTVVIETVSGDISVQKAIGRSLSTCTISGDISLIGTATESEVTLDTVSGSLEYVPSSPLHTGTVKLSAVSGDVEARFPRDTNATLRLSSVSGDKEADLYSAFPESGNGKIRNLRVSGMESVAEAIGTGIGAEITIDTVSGNISVEQAAR